MEGKDQQSIQLKFVKERLTSPLVQISTPVPGYELVPLFR